MNARRREILLLCVLSLIPLFWTQLRPAAASPVAHRQGPPQASGADAPTPRALVLEPFGADLVPGGIAGQPEIDALVAAGFKVDVYRGDQVTIPVIEGMASYSVVYLESHSGLCGPPLCKSDDAFVLTGTKVPSDLSPFGPLFFDGSLTEGSPDTNPGDIYLAFTSRLIRQHLGTFPRSSIVFINGCDVLATPGFVGALAAHGAATILSWNKRVDNADAEAAADFMFGRLAGGESVSAALADARGVGLGSSQAEAGATLGLSGNGDVTFAAALSQSDPSSTATSTTMPSPTPSPTVATPSGPPLGSGHPVSTCWKGYRPAGSNCLDSEDPSPATRRPGMYF